MEMHDVVIVDAIRSPVGKLLGGLSSTRADDLAALAIAEIVTRTKVDPEIIDGVIMGCANQAGEDNRNVARMAALLAGLPQSVPGVTVNRLCASGLEAVNIAARQIACGDAEFMVAGGVENMSRAPWVMGKPIGVKPVGNRTAYDSSLGWRFPNPKMEKLFPLEGMGETAENIVERYAISREDQDRFALESHAKAHSAWEEGRMAEEVFEVRVPQRRGDDLVVARDESIRADSTLEKMGKLRAVFRASGSVTAGNSSPLNDGSAALLLASSEAAKRHSMTVLAHWRGAAAAGIDPRVMGLGPVPATRKVLKRVGWDLGQLDLIELNEAFAAQSLGVIRELELDPERINVNGGAIAIGHPLGCSGARILTTLLYEMRRRGANRGLAALCVGVGQGVASLVERDS